MITSLSVRVGPPPNPIFPSRELFNFSRCKVYWARKHAYELSTLWEGFLERYEADPKAFQGNLGDRGQHLFSQVPIPIEVRLILGDCIRNLRSALDYLVSALAREKGLSDSQTIFPFAEERAAIEASFNAPEETKANGRKGRKAGALFTLSGLYPNLQKVICDDIRPYSKDNGGSAMGDLVWRVVTADNIDKHRLMTVAAPASTIGSLMYKDGPIVVGSQITGAFLIPIEAELQAYSDVSVAMHFGEPARLAGKPVLGTLVEAGNLVSEIIEIFETAF